MISVKGLHAGYRSGFKRTWREVLRGVSFEVARGSVTGYLGINGSGKTTTIKILVGVNPPSKGEVIVCGHPAGSAASQQNLGYFPEAPYFYEGLTGLELLCFLGQLHGLRAADRKRRGEGVLEKVGLSDARDMAIRSFSKGMRQRLGLAQALLHEPDVLILDEPLDGLDPMGRLHVRGLIAEQGAQGKTIFFSSHVLSDVEAISDHLVVLSGGRVAYQGAVSGLGGESDPRVEIRVRGLDAQALSAFGEAGGADVLVRGDGSAEMVCAGQSAADRAVDVVRAAGGQIVRLATRGESLEETFLKRFGGDGLQVGPKDTQAQSPAAAAADSASTDS